MQSNILSFFDGNPTEIISPLFGLYYWIGFCISFLLIGSLFVFKKFYAKLSQHNNFKYILGIFQIFLFFSFYIIHGLSGGYSWSDYFPFQLCSVLNITSGVLLILPLEGLFNVTFPIIGPVILAFLLPDKTKWVFGPQHFLYYDYYFIHIIIIFSYLYLYLYGHIKFNTAFLKKSILAMTLFGCGVFIFNVSFDKNYLFIGEEGYQANIGGIPFNTGDWVPIARFAFMFVVGVCLLSLTYFMIIKTLFPYFLEKGTEVNPQYENKKKLFTKIWISFKNVNARIKNKNAKTK